MREIRRRDRSLGVSGVLALLVVAGQGGTSAQELGSLPAGGNEVVILTAIEAEGLDYASRPAPAKVPGIFEAESWIGTGERTCVAIDDDTPVRSGDFLIGGRIGGDRTPVRGRGEKIWWAPVHNSSEMSLLVRGRRLDGDGVLRFETDRVGIPVNPSMPPPESVDDLDAWFFPSSFTFPRAGRWAIVATSSDNWGCFIFLVR